ncbi:hypothetical protein DFH06DRAFT_732939 [Mycena polygramma]|nr:hypothetical protein DFH06DRAFT_732939 [Mycena polygramma]
MVQLSNAGMPLPVPGDFDFDGWMKRPADVVPPEDMDLKARNEDNHAAEIHNRASLKATRHFRAVQDNSSMDVGRKLRAYWLYSTADLQSMVKSVRVCEAVGPLPVYLCLMVEQARVSRTEVEEDEKREREKERSDREKVRADREKDKVAPVIGTMVMSNPVVRTPAHPLSSRTFTFSQSFIASILRSTGLLMNASSLPSKMDTRFRRSRFALYRQRQTLPKRLQFSMSRKSPSFGVPTKATRVSHPSAGSRQLSTSWLLWSDSVLHQTLSSHPSQANSGSTVISS